MWILGSYYAISMPQAHMQGFFKYQKCTGKLVHSELLEELSDLRVTLRTWSFTGSKTYEEIIGWQFSRKWDSSSLEIHHLYHDHMVLKAFMVFKN